MEKILLIRQKELSSFQQVSLDFIIFSFSNHISALAGVHLLIKV